MSYSAVFFDADSTLLDFGRAEDHALRTIHGILGEPIPYTEFFDIYDEINRQVWTELEEKKLTPDELKIERFRRFAEALKVSIDIEELSRSYLVALGEASYYLEGAEELLNSLKGKYPLAMLTNGLTMVQEARFRLLGFDRFFDVIMISEKVGIAKPDPAIFQLAADRMKLPLDKNILMVGDGLGSDIAGAINAGITSCWYNPGGWENQSPWKADYEIAGLEELHRILEA
jgi:putative hydrolase of the HAD superfamily